MGRSSLSVSLSVSLLCVSLLCVSLLCVVVSAFVVDGVGEVVAGVSSSASVFECRGSA